MAVTAAPPQLQRSGICAPLGYRDGAAQAIMTTDTRPKLAATQFSAGGVTYTVGGVAKGAGMLHPDMATLLAFLTTDAPVPASLLQDVLFSAADQTFNCVTVDGDTSPNDTVLMFANGAAGGAMFAPGSESIAAMQEAALDVCDSLAEQLVADAEGATKHFRVSVSSAV